MSYQDYEGLIAKQALQAKALGEMKGANSVMSQRDASPIEQKISELGSALECAHEGLELLTRKLSPVRLVSPTQAGIGEKVASEACEIESRLQYLIDSASVLSRKLSDLRGELRI